MVVFVCSSNSFDFNDVSSKLTMTSLNSFQLLTESKVCVHLLIMSLYIVSTYLDEKIELLACYEKKLKNFKTIFLKTLYKANDCKRRRYELNLNNKFPTINLTNMGLFRTRESRHIRIQMIFSKCMAPAQGWHA